MKVTELIEYLETVEDEYGDVSVHATCDGWCPPEISVEMNKNSERLVLAGSRRVGGGIDYDHIEVINA